MDPGDEATKHARLMDRYERVKQRIREKRAAVLGDWALDDAEWERTTGMRFPLIPPPNLYDPDET